MVHLQVLQPSQIWALLQSKLAQLGEFEATFQQLSFMLFKSYGNTTVNENKLGLPFIGG